MVVSFLFLKETGAKKILKIWMSYVIKLKLNKRNSSKPYCVYAVLGGWETSKTAFHVNNWEKIGLSQNNWDVKMTKSTILFSTALLDFKKHILKNRNLIDFEKKIRNWPGATSPDQFLIRAKLFHHATNLKVASSQKVFHSCSNLQKDVQNHSPEH